LSIALRDYQKDSIQSIVKARGEGITRPLLVLPTGTGKTLVFAALAKQLQTKTLILAHRDELIRQAEDKVSMIWPEADIGIVKAQENDYRDKDVVCASVQTLSRANRLKQLADEDWNLLVIDESHHSCAQSYRAVIDGLGFMDNDPERLLLGVTATATRSDKLGLGHIFQKIVYQASILTMVRAGYLADIKGFRAYTGTDLSEVATRQGDFVESQLSQAVNTPERNQLVIDFYLQHASGRKALAFCADVQHAHDLARAFLEDGIEAKALSGQTPKEERREALRAFSKSEIQILTNCALFTEGYDEPSIEAVLMCRPTKSTILYTQCIGRGTRKHPGKTDCVIIDFADNRHDICQLPSLLGFNPDDLQEGESVKEEIERSEHGIGCAVATLPQVSIKEFDLLGKSIFRWFHDGAKWRLPINPGVYAILTPVNGKFKAFLVQKDEGTKLLYQTPLDLGYGQGICEDFARRFGKSFSRKDALWREQSASEKQIDLLLRLGVNPAGMNKGECSDRLEEFFAKQEVRRENRCLV